MWALAVDVIVYQAPSKQPHAQLFIHAQACAWTCIIKSLACGISMIHSKKCNYWKSHTQFSYT